MDVQAFLNSFVPLTAKQKNEILDSRFLNVKWRTLFAIIRENSDVDSTNLIIKELVENSGDWNDILPYGEETFSKLTTEEQKDLIQLSEIIKEVYQSFISRKVVVSREDKEWYDLPLGDD